MRIAVLGAGAMGSWFGGLLAIHGNSVQLLTTNDAHRQAINNQGLTLRDPNGDQIVKVAAILPNELDAPVELVMVMTKTFQTSEAMASIASAINADTHVLSLQNGLGNAENIAAFVPLERVWVGVSMMPIDKIAPGVVMSKGIGDSYFGNAADNREQSMGNQIESVFQLANIPLHYDANIYSRIWEKVAFNAGMNALSALSHGRPRTIGTSTGAKALAENVAKEVAAVAHAHNIEIDLERVYDMINLSCSQHGDHIPSMLQDLQSRRRTEVDALNGAVVAFGEYVNVKTPLNDTLSTLIKLAELSHRHYPA